MSDISQASKREGDSSQSLLSKFQRYSWTFRKWWWVILITVALGLSWAAWTDSKKPPSYISHGRMMVSGRVALPQGVTLSEEAQNFFGTQSRIMESIHVRERAASSVESKFPELRASTTHISVATEKGTSFFNLTAIGEEPNYTRAFLDACMEQYIKLKREWWSDIIAQKMVLLTDAQLKEEKELDSAFAELVEFQKRNNLSALGEEGGNSAGRRLAQLEEKLAAMKDEYRLLQVLDVEQNIERKKQSATGSTTGDSDADAGAAPSGAELEYLKAKQDLQIIKAEKMRRSKVMRPKHPLMVKLDAEISQQESIIALFYDQSLAQLANRRESLKLVIESLEAAVKDWGEKTLELAGKLAAYDKLKTKVEQSKAQQNNLQLSNNQVAVDARLQDDVIKVMDQASPPEAIKPDLIKNLAIGAMLGALAGLVVMFLIGTLDDRVTSAIELRERFPEPLLGHIPHEIAAGDKRLSMLSVNNKQGIFVEAYRNLRSTLHFMSLEEPRPKAFLVTSAVPGEGKSTVAVNLGMILAGGGSKTLLIDADLRKGLLHSYFDVETAPGLIEILNGDVKWEDALVKTEVKNLTLIPRGKGGVGQSEFFMSDAADDFLRAVYAAGYDRIVIDSAPILATDDTACLAPKIDATLFVVRAEASSMRLTRTALDALHKRQVNVLGLILNAANLRSSEYQYYHKYGDYYSETPKMEKPA
jgi:polysaccharide biosynthesis transport protein